MPLQRDWTWKQSHPTARWEECVGVATPSCVPSLYYNTLFCPRVSWQRSKERGLSHGEALFSMLRHGLAHSDLDRGWEASRAKEGWICAGIAREIQRAWGREASEKCLGNAGVTVTSSMSKYPCEVTQWSIQGSAVK